jgi:DNA polymerase II
VKCTAKVFLLTSEWSDVEGQTVLTYYGRSPKLGPVEIVINNFKCSFMVLSSIELPELNCKFSRKSPSIQSFHGEAVDSLIFNSYNDARSAADRLKMAGIQTFEADIKPNERFLMENFINGQLAVHGVAEKKGKLVSFTNPAIKPCEVNTELRIASFDIECSVPQTKGRLTTEDMAKQGVLYSIACHMSGAGGDKEICFMLGEKRETRDGHLEIYPTEQGVLNAFLEWFQNEDPDIVIGWHVIGFDLMYLQAKCEAFYTDLTMSRNGRKPYFNSPPSGGNYATISGRVVLDGPPCMRDAGYSFNDFKLETVAQELLGEGKIITASKEDKIAEIEDFFHNDKDMLSKYNIQDCVLVTKVFNHVDMLNFMVNRVKASGLLMPSIAISNAAFDHLYIPRLHRLGYCAPPVSDAARSAANPDQINQTPGIYENVCIFELTCLQESLMTAFCIDPLARLIDDGDCINTPSLMSFSKKKNALAKILSNLKEASLQTDSSFAKATAFTGKMLINALRSGNNRFYSYDLLAALDDCIRWFIISSKKILEQEGYVVCAASTHNLYIQMKPQEAASTFEHADLLANRLTTALQEKAQTDFNVELDLSITCKKHLQQMVIPQSTGFTKEAIKDIRFASFEGEHKELTGLRISGTDWTKVTSLLQEKMYQAQFEGQNLEEWMKIFVEELKAGEYDSLLTFTRKLTKNVDEYSGSLPPHVKAAKLLQDPGKFITYYMTSRGPVPAELNPNDIDYQYYLDKQLAPIADSLLGLVNLQFENLFKAQQLSLFDF